jgi:hypothetical protein
MLQITNVMNKFDWFISFENLLEDKKGKIYIIFSRLCRQLGLSVSDTNKLRAKFANHPNIEKVYCEDKNNWPRPQLGLPARDVRTVLRNINLPSINIKVATLLNEFLNKLAPEYYAPPPRSVFPDLKVTLEARIENLEKQLAQKVNITDFNNYQEQVNLRLEEMLTMEDLEDWEKKVEKNFQKTPELPPIPLMSFQRELVREQVPLDAIRHQFSHTLNLVYCSSLKQWTQTTSSSSQVYEQDGQQWITTTGRKVICQELGVAPF